VCCGYAVSDSCYHGSAKDFSGENLQKLIKTGQLYVNWLPFTFLYYVTNCFRAAKYVDSSGYRDIMVAIFSTVVSVATLFAFPKNVTICFTVLSVVTVNGTKTETIIFVTSNAHHHHGF